LRKSLEEEEDMINTIKKMGVLSLVFAMVMSLGMATAEAQTACVDPCAGAKLVPKVDNFILFPDQSGSMYMTHKGMKEIKMVLVKNLLLQMNELIPELGYTGAADMFAPFQELLAPMVYERGQMGAALQSIPEKQGIYGRMTPMGPGIDQLGPVLAGLSGKTAIIMVSDGKHNLGADPVMMARSLYNQYPEICFHVVSFAEDAEGEAINKAVNEVGGSCVYADGPGLLQDKTALEQFVKDVFYDCEDVMEEVIVLRGIHFDFDKSNIKSEWAPVLDEAIAILQANPNMSIIIEGHTDSKGSEAYNQGLSERRANSVYRYLMNGGVAGNRMSTVGYGELRPKATNATDEGRAINRRVEFQVQ
jgi:OOP family OmpA-OmpF porin